MEFKSCHDNRRNAIIMLLSSVSKTNVQSCRKLFLIIPYIDWRIWVININAFGKTKVFFKRTCPSDMKTVIYVYWLNSYCVHNVIIFFQNFPALRKDKFSLFSVIVILKNFHFDLHFLPGTLVGILISFLKTSTASSN